MGLPRFRRPSTERGEIEIRGSPLSRVSTHKFSLSFHSPTVAMVSQSCKECPAFCDDVLGWGSAAGAETLVSAESWSLALGSFTAAAAPADDSMGRGAHGVTAPQRQLGHQQLARTRVPELAAERTMETNSAGLREVGGTFRSRPRCPRTRVGSAGPEPTARLFIPGGSRLGGDGLCRRGSRVSR